MLCVNLHEGIFADRLVGSRGKLGSARILRTDGVRLNPYLEPESHLGETCFYIVEYIHEIDVAVVGGVVGGEVFVDIAVGPVFGAHVVEVVAGGEFAPVGDDVFDFLDLLGVGFGFDLDHAIFEDFFDTVGFFECVVLHGVASPGGEVAFGVGP